MRTSDGFLLIIVISIIFTTMAAIAERQKLGSFPIFWINILRVVHYFVFFFGMIYAFIFDEVNLDLMYLAFMMWLFGHWTYLKNECVLGYIENRHYIPDYKMGDYVGNNMYIRLILGDLTRPFILAFGFISLASVFMVLARVPITVLEKALITFVMVAFMILGFGTKHRNKL
jgi:hypothetical protein